jgi:hypothetical protein
MIKDIVTLVLFIVTTLMISKLQSEITVLQSTLNALITQSK